MKKILPATIIILLVTSFLSNYHPDEQSVYILFTSVSEQKDGISVLSDIDTDTYENYPSIHYSLHSRNKDLLINFLHINFKESEISKIRDFDPGRDMMHISTEPESFLDGIEYIDMDAVLPTLTSENAKTFKEQFRDKKVFMIDRNDFADGMIKVVEVRCIFGESGAPVMIKDSGSGGGPQPEWLCNVCGSFYYEKVPICENCGAGENYIIERDLVQ